MDGPTLIDQLSKKTPLAHAVLALLQWSMPEELLEGVFEAHRGRNYHRVLSFSTMVELMWDCLTNPQVSARSTFLNAQENGELPVSSEACYQKLSPVPIEVSVALVLTATERLKEVLPEIKSPMPECFACHQMIVGDGKTIKNVHRRRKELRYDQSNACKLLGGKSVVLRDQHTGLMPFMVPDENGMANETKHLDILFDHLSQRQNYIFVGDRAYGIFEVCRLAHEMGDHFIVRRHNMMKFVADESARS